MHVNHPRASPKETIQHCCLLAFSIALLCKRENLALLFIPLVSSLFDYYLDRKQSIIGILKKLLPYLIIIAIYLVGIQNVFEIESVESGDIGTSTFSYKYFEILFPVFVKSLFSIYSFSIVVNDGVIEDSGTHYELLERCSEYRKLYEKELNS